MYNADTLFGVMAFECCNQKQEILFGDGVYSGHKCDFGSTVRIPRVVLTTCTIQERRKL
jgi:hypothetical protein